MNAKRTAIGIAVAIFVWINVLTVLLSTYQYGYVDWAVVGQMGLIAVAPLAIAAVFTLRGAHGMATGAHRGSASGLGNVRRTAAAGR